MAAWVTHLMIADMVMKRVHGLDRRGFCAGNIAPDCNIENEDWTKFIPPREVTHWMSGDRKAVSDCDAFCRKYIVERRDTIKSNEHYSFLLGYCSHLITDASFYQMLREEKRVNNIWRRIKSDENMRKRAEGLEETWDGLKKVMPKSERMHEIHVIEAEYLRDHPDSGYFTEILTMQEFPDYIDYMPKSSIVRKIGIMKYMPELDEAMVNPISISREEYADFVNSTAELVMGKFEEFDLI